MGTPLSEAAGAAAQRCLEWAYRALCLVAAMWIGTGAVVCAHADDRPFLRTTHAMASDDDDAWEISSTLVANRQGQALSLQLERELSTTQRIEVEVGGSTRDLAPEPEQGLRLRSLWVNPESHGWGWATKVGIEPRRGRSEGGDRWQALSVVSVPMAQGRWWVHANLGWQWQRQSAQAAQRTAIGSLAAHWVLNPQQWLYAETARAADGSDRLLHLGLRHWLRPGKWALDVGAGRQRAAEHPGEFVVLNMSFFDLNF